MVRCPCSLVLLLAGLLPLTLVPQSPRAGSEPSGDGVTLAVTRAHNANIVSVDSLPSLRIPIDNLIDRPNLGVLLGHHDVILITRNGRTLVGYDSTGRQRWREDITPGGSGGFAWFTSLLHETPRRVLMWDDASNRLTELDVNGGVHGRRGVDALPKVRIAGGARSRQLLTTLGRFQDGEIIAMTMFGPNGEDGLRYDSAKVVRIDRDGGVKVIGRVLLAQMYTWTAPHLVQGVLPFGRVGRLAVGGSSWYYTDGERFTIERRGRDGALLSTFGVPRARRPVDAEAIRLSRLRALADVDSAHKSSLIRALAWMPYPDTMAAYDDLRFDSSGMLWAKVSAPDWEVGFWDLFSPSGQRLGEVRLPPDLRVLDIIDDALLAYHSEPGGQNELQVYGLRRARQSRSPPQAWDHTL